MEIRAPEYFPNGTTYDIKGEEIASEAMVKPEKFELETPSPAISCPPSFPTVHTNGHGPKRPIRKSTLTQQQKNQKRQRATQDQLGTLEVEFNNNPTPNASVRERIASEINMTERSVQIWFQNRRAKIKNLAKKSIENGEDCEAIPDSMRRYLALQAIDGTPMANAEYFSPYGPGLLMPNEASSKVMIYHLNCRSLTIGTWRRVGQTQLDLVIFYSPVKSMITYYIQAEATGFRIEYPFSSIKSISLEGGDNASNAEGTSSEDGCINVELSHPPLFTMDQGSNGWFQCRDFTEDQQASKVLSHQLGGHPKILSNQLSKLTSLDAFRNRFGNEHPPKPALASPMPVVDTRGLENRPSSQPNHTVHPHASLFPDNSFQMGPPPPRGHKRQRSRSVPSIGIDFGPRSRQPMAPFLVHQHHHVHHHNTVQNINAQNQIFAPVPQYAHPMPPFNNHNSFGAVGPPLQVDPSSGFNFDFNTPAPSATTGTTPPSSEFEHSLYPPPPYGYETLSAPQPQGHFAGHYLSPVLGSPGNPNSASPMSNMGQPMQQISPTTASPHHPLFRSASADARIPMPIQDEFYNDFMPSFPDDGFAAANAKFDNFEESRFEPDRFADNINWVHDEQTNALPYEEHHLVDHSSKPSLSLPFRDPVPEAPQEVKPEQAYIPPAPASPPPPEVYEFDDLVNMTP